MKQSSRPVGDKRVSYALIAVRHELEGALMYIERAEDALASAQQYHEDNDNKAALLMIAEYHSLIERAKESL